MPSLSGIADKRPTFNELLITSQYNTSITSQCRIKQSPKTFSQVTTVIRAKNETNPSEHEWIGCSVGTIRYSSTQHCWFQNRRIGHNSFRWIRIDSNEASFAELVELNDDENNVAIAIQNIITRQPRMARSHQRNRNSRQSQALNRLRRDRQRQQEQRDQEESLV
jgi:hypothetical protein